MKVTYLKKVMNGRMFKVLHWHIITWIHFIVSDDFFERLPCITLVQHQVWRMLRQLWGMSPTSFSWRGKILRLDGCQLTIGSSKSTVGGVNFGTLGRGALLGLCFLRPRWLGRLPRSTKLDIDFFFLVWMADFMITEGVVSSWICMSSSPLVPAFYLFPFMVAIPMMKKTKINKWKKNGQCLLRQVVSLCARFSAEGTGPSAQVARRPKVTRPWKDLLGKAWTWSIRSK